MAKAALIGISGLARSGKDTVADFILAEIGGYRYSFADPIRAMLRQLSIDMDDPYWKEHKEEKIPALGVSPRRMMQTLGTEWGRECVNENLWLILAQQHLLRNGPGMIVADVRFDNEAEWVRNHNGLLIHIFRPMADNPVEMHKSEGGVLIKDTDAQLFNNGTLEELQAKVRELVSGL